MKIGVYIRNMGPGATREAVLACARAAEDAGLDDVWIYDHLAIPPDQAEGSQGYYLEPLATLAFLAGATERIGLGTGILVVPYRPALLLAKTVATVQALSGGRVRLGVGVGWMEEEFRALGIDRSQRGRLTDAGLEMLRRCFAADEASANGQAFLFRPRPPCPPIYVGGRGPHALRRAALLGDGWLPTEGDAEALRAPVAELRRIAAEAGRPEPEVVAAVRLAPDDAAAREELARLAEIGVGHVALRPAYATVDEFRRSAERAARLRGAA